LHHGSRPTFDPKTGDLVISIRVGGQGLIHRVSADGSAVTLTHDGDSFDPSVSKDGSHIVFAKRTDRGKSAIWIMDTDGRNPRRLSADAGRSTYPVLLAAGKPVIFARAATLRNTSTGGTRWIDWDVYQVPNEGGVERRITNARLRAIDSVDLLPGGQGVILGTDRLDSTARLDVVDLQSGQMRAVGVPEDSAAAVAPSSGRITFLRDVGDYNYEIFVMEPDGSGRRQLTNLKSYTSVPTFSPDERRVLFLSDPGRNQRFSLWEARMDGSSRLVPLKYDLP
jgi:Tol biopolymer transport system component